jgi:hypothetical protein
MLEFFVANLKSQGAKIGYYGLLNGHLPDLPQYAKETGGHVMSKMMASLPLSSGIKTLRQVFAGNRIITKPGKSDGFYEFCNTARNPVYIGCLSFLMQDFSGRMDASCMTLIAAKTEDEARAFVDACHDAKRLRNRNKRTILTHHGERIELFREMRWEDIFLPGNTVSEIRHEINNFFVGKQFYEDHLLDWRRGMLLSGPSGNGKTVIARAIATTSQVPVIYCSANETGVMDMLRGAQETITANAPCIAIFEDADSLSLDELSRSSFLNMLDGLLTSSGVFTIATTNAPGKLDVAFLGRPSRFDSYYVIPNPTKKTIEQILKSKLGSKANALGDLHKLVSKMDGLSAACVQEVAVYALRKAANDGRPLSVALLVDGTNKIRAHLTRAKDGTDTWAGGSMGFGAQTSDKADSS